jgi:hypothetical protein
MTIQEAARVALDCQDACNLSGVLASFKEVVHEVLWPEARRLGKGTEWVNQHPVCTLFQQAWFAQSWLLRMRLPPRQ